MDFWSWACRPLSFPHSCWSAITVFFFEGDFTHQSRCGDELRAGEHFERWVILSGTSERQNMRSGQRRFVRKAGEIRLSRATNACANTIPIKPAALRLHRLKMNVDLCILCERSLSYPTHRRRRSRLNCAYTLATLREDPDIGMTSTQGRCFRALFERAQRQFTMPQKSKIVLTLSQIRQIIIMYCHNCSLSLYIKPNHGCYHIFFILRIVFEVRSIKNGWALQKYIAYRTWRPNKKHYSLFRAASFYERPH